MVAFQSLSCITAMDLILEAQGHNTFAHWVVHNLAGG